MIKKTLLGGTLLLASSVSMAAAPGGPGCGWGNMLLEGNSGLPMHLLASITNGTSGNATFGMTSGTNGCSTDGNLTYGGKSLIGAIMDEFSQDVALGEGEAINAVAVSMGVEKQDRDHFAKVMQENFTTLFPSAGVKSQDVYLSMVKVMKSDQTLSKYVA